SSAPASPISGTTATASHTSTRTSPDPPAPGPPSSHSRTGGTPASHLTPAVAATEFVIISDTTRVTASVNCPSPHSTSTFRACPRALPGAFRYAPSSRKDRSGNPFSQFPLRDPG